MTWPACVQLAQRYSHRLSARYYGFPVYLVGGAISDPNPRDIDLVIPLPRDVFVATYGDEGQIEDVDRAISAWCGGTGGDDQGIWNRWARDCAKISLEMTLYCARSVDFKTQYQDYFDSIVGPRVRLSRPIRKDDSWT